MPSRQTCWNTRKELSFLQELASRDLLEFGTSRHGRNRIVNCEQALAGYMAAFEARADWQTIDRHAIHEWLTQHMHRRTAEGSLPNQSALSDSEHAAEANAATKSLSCESEYLAANNRIDSQCGNSDNHA